MRTLTKQGKHLKWKYAKRKMCRLPIGAMQTEKRAEKMRYESPDAQKAKRARIGKLRFLQNGGAPRPIDPQFIPPHLQAEVPKRQFPALTRNSSCPCGSGHRFKGCCMISVKDKVNQAVGGVA